MDSNLLSLPNSSSTSRCRYHVFLSFRGKDTRYKFTDHLYAALVKSSILPFKDDKNLEKGKAISPELLKAIEGSRCAIAIISENYAFSISCLDELVKITKCEKELGMIILPVFYHVRPSDVREQKKTFKKAFDEHERRFEEKRVKTWRDALIHVTGLSGFTLENTSPEAQIIQSIVTEISKHVGTAAGCHLKNISPETQDIQRILRQISHTVKYEEFSGLTNEDLVNFEKPFSVDATVTAQAASDEANMEELHMAALAYYGNASNEICQRATEYFKLMDTNGDGGVSFNEFNEFFVLMGCKRVDPNIFRSLDRNGNGFLDFFEVVTFYYMLQTRLVCCNYCGIYQAGLYYTCVVCFEHARSTGDTYDLCSMCYTAGRHQQQHPLHNHFFNSCGLPRAMAGLGAPNVRCGCCGILMEQYFTCVACFDNARSTGHTYDLCSTCYGARRHRQQHPHHNYFLDSYVLVLFKAGLPILAGAPNLQQALVQHAPNISQQGRSKAFQALETALIVVNTAAHSCSIM